MRRVYATIILFTLLAALLQPGLEASPVRVEIQSIIVGKRVNGNFVENKERVFKPGETLYVKTKVLVRGARNEAYELKVTYTILDPFNHTFTQASTTAKGRITVGTDQWEFPFILKLEEDMYSGLYTILVTVEYGKGKTFSKTWFLLVEGIERENLVEIEYRLTLTGKGKVNALYIALIQETPWIKIVAGPVFNPSPSEIMSDSIGNRYAVYRNIKIAGEKTFRIKYVVKLFVGATDADAPITSLNNIPEHIKRYTEPSQYIESNNPAIKLLAQKITRGSKTVREALEKIADYVSTNIKYNVKLGTLTQTWKLGALWTLNAKQGICLQFSRLYVALARAAGIPARVVGGFGFLEPGQDIEGDYLHAYVEAYIPGKGWLPIEPQFPGNKIGLIPPHPGHIALLKGLGEKTTLDDRETEAVMFMYRYEGSVESKFTYKYTYTPIREKVEQAKPKIEGPLEVMVLDKAEFTVYTGTEEPSLVEVTITSPTGETWTFDKQAAGTLKVVLQPNETGTWKIEAIVYPKDLLPGYAQKQFTVNARDLKLTIQVDGTQLLDTIHVKISTTPPLPGIPIQVYAATCLNITKTTLYTDDKGTATLDLGLALLPCKIHVEATTQPPGYKKATTILETTIKTDRAVIAAIAVILLILVISLLRRR